MPASSGILRVPALRSSLAVLLAILLGVTWGGGGEVVEASHLPNVVAIVKAGAHIRSVAVNESTNRVYIGNEASDTVSVLDGVTNNLIDTDGNPGNGITPISVGDVPTSIAVNSSTNRVYVANFYGNSVSVINGATNAVLTTIATGGQASGIAVNPTTNRIYVGDWTNDSIHVIDGGTNSITATVPLLAGAQPHPLGVAVNPTTDRIYVADWSNSIVSVIDGATNTKITDLTVGSGASGVAVNPSTNRIYVSAGLEGAVKVIDGASNAVLASIPVEGTRGLAVDPTTNRVYSSREAASQLVVIDGYANVEITSLAITPSALALAANPTTGRVYVGSWSNDVITAIAFPTHPLGASLINFQGRLTDSVGNPVANGNYSVAFRIYDAAAGGSVKWQETQTVAVSGSVFSVLLGSVNPLEAGHLNGEPRYLEVQVGADPPLSPRQRFTSVPYAFNAQSLDGVGLDNLQSRDGIVLHIGAAQNCPANFTLLMDVSAGVNGTDASRACSTTTYTQVFYIGSTQTCPTGWMQMDINAAVVGTTAADACYR